MNSRHLLVIGLVIVMVSGCTETKLVWVELEKQAPAIKLLGNTINGAFNLIIRGDQNHPTTKIDSLSNRIKDTQLCVHSTSGFGENWEKNPAFKSKVQEAKEKGLTLTDCARLLSG
jgi:hypothetical protein